MVPSSAKTSASFRRADFIQHWWKVSVCIILTVLNTQLPTWKNYLCFIKVLDIAWNMGRNQSAKSSQLFWDLPTRNIITIKSTCFSQLVHLAKDFCSACSKRPSYGNNYSTQAQTDFYQCKDPWPIFMGVLNNLCATWMQSALLDISDPEHIEVYVGFL